MVVIVPNSLSLGLSLGLSGLTGGELTPENAAGLSKLTQETSYERRCWSGASGLWQPELTL